MSPGDSAPWIRKIALTFYRREEGQNRLIKITNRLTGFHKIEYFLRSIFAFIYYLPTCRTKPNTRQRLLMLPLGATGIHLRLSAFFVHNWHAICTCVEVFCNRKTSFSFALRYHLPVKLLDICIKCVSI